MSSEVFEILFLSGYFSAIFISLLIVVDLYINRRAHENLQTILLNAYSLYFICIFGFRSFSVGVDTETYIAMFRNADIGFSDLGFGIYNLLNRYTFNNDTIFLLGLSALYLIPINLAIKNLTKANRFLLFSCLISYFFFKAMGINTIRQGVAFSFFLWALSVDKKLTKYLLYFLSVSFHISLLIPIMTFEFSKRLKSLFFPLLVLFACTVSSILNIPDIKGIFGLDLAIMSRFSIRPDFFLFNMMYGVIGWIIYKHYNSQLVFRYLVCYLLLSGIFFLTFNIGYSDRIGFLAWLFIPLMLSKAYADRSLENGNRVAIFSLLNIAIALVFYVLKG